MNEMHEAKKNSNKEIVLYSTGCPKCNVLKNKLNDKNIKFCEFTDKNAMAEKGIIKVPVLEVDGKMMDFVEANDWVNNKKCD